MDETVADLVTQPIDSCESFLSAMRPAWVQVTVNIQKEETFVDSSQLLAANAKAMILEPLQKS